jgi:hypothetical protein
MEYEVALIYRSIEDSIQKWEDADILDAYLEEFPLELLEDEDADMTVVYFLQLCESSGNKQAVFSILQRWERVYPAHTRLFSLDWTSSPTEGDVISSLSFIETALLGTDMESSYAGHMMTILSTMGGQEAVLGATRLSSVYERQSVEMYKFLLDYLQEMVVESNIINDEVKDYLEELYSEASQIASIPSYLIGNDGLLTSHDELVDLLPQAVNFNPSDAENVDSEDALFILKDAISALPGVTLREDTDTWNDIVTGMKSSNPQERTSIVSSIMEYIGEIELQKDRLTFQVLGPVNPIKDPDELNSRGKSPCVKHGGCRMMTCYELENFGDDGHLKEEDVEDTGNYSRLEWFTFKCDSCNKKIEQKHHAVRIPVTDGGWMGCYCSWQCVRDDISGPEVPPSDRDKVMEAMVDIYEGQCSDVGIFDRYWPEKVKQEVDMDGLSSFLGSITIRSRIPDDNDDDDRHDDLY